MILEAVTTTKSITSILDGAGFQIATICICISCIFYSLVHSKPAKFQNKLYIAISVNILVSATCNLLSALTKPYIAGSDILFSVCCASQYFYFIFHCLLAPLFCFYVAIVTGANYKLKKSMHLLYEFPGYISLFLVMINPFTHWVWYFDEQRAFQRNWAEYVIYGISIIYYIIAVILLLFLWDAVSVNVRRVMVFFFCNVTLGTLLQFLFIPLHTELFSEAIAMAAILMTLENEEGLRDSRTKIYNHAALAYDVQRYIKVRKSFFLICIKMQNPSGMMQLIGPANIEKLTSMTAGYFATLVPRYSIYYIGTGTFVIINNNSSRDYNINLAKKIKERFNYSWNFQDRESIFNAAVFCVEIPTDLKSFRDIMMLINSPAPMERHPHNDIYYGSGLNYILRRSQVEEAIVNGLDNKSFEVFYQPIYNTSDMTICSGEALLRLHDSHIGDIYPDEFLPIAERNGMIFDLGDFVLDEVCKFLNSGIPTEMGITTLNVNLSVIQCIQSNYADRIIALVSKYDISPARISFEITESAATTDFGALRNFVSKLRDYGFRFTVDDYGIGYSNVHSILSLDIDTIKIDRSILWEAEQSETGRIIMDSSVAMIKRMGKQILITGVETKQQVELASEYGVEFLQGYFFSNPITQNEFIGILKATQIARFEEQKALAASEAMSNFLANMSHEIRTPINAVLGMDEMILRESNDDKIIEYARTIEGAGRTLLSLINDILDFSKIEAGSIEIIENEYELSTLLSDVVNMVTVRASKKDLKIITEVDPTTPDRLIGDEVRIRQIMLNLVNNAIKYTEKGSVTLRIGYEKTNKSSMCLKADIIDTGIGIREEDIGKLFEKFKRLDLDKNKTVEGSGLGLAITNQLLQHMGGKIHVESEYGKGSTFSIEIPQTIADGSPIGDFRKKSAQSRTTVNQVKEFFEAPDAHILVVDDTEINLIVVRELLKRTKIQIDEAASGRECLEYAAKNKYDIIFLDYRMPEMDGIETLNHLNELENNKNTDTPIITLTANAIVGARERFLKEGFTDYVTKPIDGEKIEEVLKTYLPAGKIHMVSNPEYGKPIVPADTSDDESLLDIHSGIMNCGSESVYHTVLQTFREEIPKRTRTIRTALANNDIKRYTIEVHSIKSSSRIIGAERLSKFAEALEEAGEKNDIEQINNKTDEFLTLYDKYAHYTPKGMQAQKSAGIAKNAPYISSEQWIDALKTLQEFADAMDYDNAMLVTDALNEYQFSPKLLEAKKSISSMVFNLEWAELKTLLEELLQATK